MMMWRTVPIGTMRQNRIMRLTTRMTMTRLLCQRMRRPQVTLSLPRRVMVPCRRKTFLLQLIQIKQQDGQGPRITPAFSARMIPFSTKTRCAKLVTEIVRQELQGALGERITETYASLCAARFIAP